MTAGNQGKAYDDAVEALKSNPNDSNLKAEVERTKAALNQSLVAAHQTPVS